MWGLTALFQDRLSEKPSNGGQSHEERLRTIGDIPNRSDASDSWLKAYEHVTLEELWHKAYFSNRHAAHAVFEPAGSGF